MPTSLPCPRLLATALALLAPLAQAHASTGDAAHWSTCAAQTDSAQRLACFDAWAARQGPGTVPAPHASAHTGPLDAPPQTSAPMASNDHGAPSEHGCRDTGHTTLARFWELEAGSSCGTLRFRGYRPISASVVASDSVNRQPSSAAPGHSASAATGYRSTEARIQLSVRTKLAQNLLTRASSQNPHAPQDSLWLGYTQQSYWQLFTPQISRPFRSTDHEPEVLYVYPTDLALPWGWRWRYSGVGAVHQSNGQSLPLSRSWNRTYLMAGIELGEHLNVNARLWKRLPESASSDDNPGISDYVGRGELSAFWSPHPDHTLGLTLRHTLSSARRGSARLEWMQTLGQRWSSGKSNLRLHAQLFSGYGDSLVDYNRQRTVFTLGLSLVDF